MKAPTPDGDVVRFELAPRTVVWIAAAGAGLRMILEELGVDMPGDDSDDPSARARDRKTEAAYEQMSAGSTAPEAGQIASELAHGIREADAWVAASEAKKKAP